MKYYICIADIHGMADKLEVALSDCRKWIEDRRNDGRISVDDVQFVFLGDLIDRGPDSKKVVQMVMDEVKTGAWALLGNHDEFLVGTATGGYVEFKDAYGFQDRHVYCSDLWDENGGIPTCVQMFGYKYDEHFRTAPSVTAWKDDILKSKEYEFLSKLPRMIETPHIFFCHAPISDPKSFTNTDLIWSKSTDYGKQDSVFKVPKNKIVSVHGHFTRLGQGITFPRIVNYDHGGRTRTVILADSGCGYSGGELHPVILSEMTKDEGGEDRVWIEAIL